MTNVLVSTICSTNVQGYTEEDGKAQAKKVFAALDIDKDGRVGMEEFITVGMTTMTIQLSTMSNIPAKFINLHFRDA